MKTSCLFLLLLIAASCVQRTDSVQEESLTYDQLLAGFEQQFSELEGEYEAADDQRKIELEALFQELEMTLVEAQKAFIRSNPDSLRCISILHEIDWSFRSAEEFRSYLDLIEPYFSDNGDYGNLSDLVGQMENVLVGRIAPDFEMKDSHGDVRSLSVACQNASFLLLDFWSSTCGPCRLENPNIRKAYDKFHSKGFDVFGVSTDTREEAWLKAVDEDGLSWTNVCSLEQWGDNEVVYNYALRQVSQNFLLDSQGKILATDLRGDELQNMLLSLMEEAH